MTKQASYTSTALIPQQFDAFLAASADVDLLLGRGETISAHDNNHNQLHVGLINYCGPGYGTGTPIILQRHLNHLRNKGHQVTLCAPPSGCRPSTGDNTVDWLIEIPHRRIWWPPFRSGIKFLYEIRISLIANYIVKKLQSSCLTHIITTPYSIYPDVAIKVGRKLCIPLLVLHHDQEEIWSKSEVERKISIDRTKKLYDNADVIMPVTEKLSSVYGYNAEKLKIILPIPGSLEIKNSEGRLSSTSDFVYAGSIFPYHISFLKNFIAVLFANNSDFYIIGDRNDLSIKILLETAPNVHVIPFFKSNDEAVQFVANRAATFLVVYEGSQDNQAWSRTSFPSKFLDFCRARVPIAIFAPENSAIASWCQDRKWPTFTSNFEEAEIRRIVELVSIPARWNEFADQSAMLSNGEFCHRAIQNEFEEALRLASQNYAARVVLSHNADK